jgi:hypothetical protein
MSSTKQPVSKTANVARMQAMINGLQKRFPNGNFTLGNTAFTTTSLATLFQSVIDATAKANAAQATAKVAVTAMRTASANAGPVFLSLKRLLVSTYGAAADVLGDFGLEPPKARAPRTTEQKAATTAKARSTRQARGTTSKKQKLAIKGDVTGVVVTPITATPAAPPTQPAPTAPSAPANPVGTGTKS